jgi:hypothetical protein
MMMGVVAIDASVDMRRSVNLNSLVFHPLRG